MTTNEIPTDSPINGIHTSSPAEPVYVSDTYDLLARDGSAWWQFAILGPREAATVVREAASGYVLAIGNKGDRHSS